MKKLLSLFILMLLPMLASAQTAPERRMLEQGKVWAYTYHHFEARETPTADSSYYDHSTWLSYYQLEGDTVIDGRTYMKLYRWDDHDRKHKYFGAFREDDEGKVFMYNLEDKKQDDLVLDFSLHYNRGYFPDVVRTAETIKVGDQLFRRYRYQDVSPDGRQYMLPYIAIEGIGFIERGLIFDPYAPEPDCICDYESLTYVYDDHFRFSASDFHAPKEIERSDYLPFVEIGKQWHVVSTPTNPYVPCSYERYEMYDEEKLNGKTYVRTGLFYDESVVEGFHEIGLFREENRRVYKYEAGRDVMMYDFSLKEGDTFTYEVGFDQPVNCKVLKQGWLEDGPQIQMLDSLTADGAWTFKYRKLRTWTIGIDNGSGDYYEFITWIEYIGALRNMFSLPETDGGMSCLAYIERSDEYDYLYLPFSLYNMYGPIYGCNIPKMAADRSEKWDSQYTYELEGDRLHVFGKDVLNCVGDYYAYFTEKPTDDPLVHKLHFSIKEVGPQTTCSVLFTTDFYVSGFNPNINYIIVDNYGEEHPVINKTPQMAYRPLVEEGKHWTYDNYMPLRPEKYDHYYYYDLKGDTLIAGLHCLKMYSENSYNNNAICYEGALYEVNKKVYCFFPEKNQAELLYDFDCTVGDTIQVREGQLAVKDIRTEDNGGIAIRKYILMPVVAAEDYMGEIFWVEGVGATKDFFGMLPLDGNYNTLNACELNGEKIYQTIERDLTEEGYHKMAIEGKRWNYIHYRFQDGGWHEEPYSYVVKGDTIIRRTTYKKLYYQDEKTERFECLLLERGRAVYKNTDLGNNSYESPLLTSFFDFGRDDFGRVFTWKAQNDFGNTNWMVYGVDTIEVNNCQFRRFTCLQKYSKEDEKLTTIDYDGEGVWHDIWVEGVGSASRGIEDQYPSHEPQVRSTSDYTTFVSCYENGECIFTADDFNIQTTTKSDEDMDYLPFVKVGKKWNVVRSDFDRGYHHEYYKLMNEKVEKAGKTYMKMYRSEDDLDVVYDTGLFREEDRKVYFFDDAMQKEYLMFDFSLQAGDTYETYSYNDQKMVSYKVLSVDNYTEGPEVIRYEYDEKGDSMVTHHRLLRKWTVRRMDNNLEKTWIEGAGSLEGPLGNLQDVVLPGLTKDYLAYVEYKGKPYLPFSFYDTMNKQIHGCNLPTGAEDYKENDEHHKLTYELEGNRLHIYGKVFTQCGPNNYAYFYEKKTDDPLVNKIEFVIQEVEPLADCMALHATNFYVPGFDPNMNYIVVDNQGVEHPVINKTPQMDYRPFVEEGKVWKVGTIPTALDSPVQVVDYYYFDGDTIIGGKTCKQMMCQRYVSPNYSNEYWTPRPSLTKVGAWYEEDKKVYSFDERQQTMTLKYDFSLEANDTLHFLNVDDYPPFIIGPKQTGGIEGFKGVYREIMIGQDMHNTIWLEGVGVRDAPFRNAYDPRADLVPEFLISCTVGDEIIYLNDRYEDEATPESMGARKNRFDFTHTIKTKPKAPMRRVGEMALYGEYSQQQLAINLNPLDDAYLVRITDETGKVVYEKAINAGSIVGLNIDISAYAKSRYTVTVENSNESFTGEFEAQTTGIEAISYQPSAVRHHIYNLQGQRLSTLQKGLNIVNGQKIYVK